MISFSIHHDEYVYLSIYRSIPARFYINPSPENPPLPHCPALVEKEFRTYFDTQQGCDQFEIEMNSGSKQSFVVKINAVAFARYVTQNKYCDAPLLILSDSSQVD
jgi:hypothetical protein